MLDYSEISRRLISALGNDNNKYYVYALCDDKGKVFYIGKGTGGRVLSHKEELEREKKEINQIRNKEERDRRRREFSAKKNKINELNDKIKQVIIKYGLTEEEAFMAESALINIMRFTDADLCNIANGHASQLEKESKASEKTKARDVNEFINECAPESINADEIDKGILDKSIFISFNVLAPFCTNRNLIWDAVRGEWPMDIRKANKVRYIFAMNNSIIKAVFEVKENQIREILSDDNSQIPKLPETPKESRINRKIEYDLAARIAEIYKNYSNYSNAEIKDLIGSDSKALELTGKAFNLEGDEKKICLKKWMRRKYFTERVTENEDELNLKYGNKILMVNGSDYRSPQGSFRYGSTVLNDLRETD